jgi:hypothetical protein
MKAAANMILSSSDLHPSRCSPTWHHVSLLPRIPNAAAIIANTSLDAGRQHGTESIFSTESPLLLVLFILYRVVQEITKKT